MKRSEKSYFVWAAVFIVILPFINYFALLPLYGYYQNDVAVPYASTIIGAASAILKLISAVFYTFAAGRCLFSDKRRVRIASMAAPLVFCILNEIFPFFASAVYPSLISLSPEDTYAALIALAAYAITAAVCIAILQKLRRSAAASDAKAPFSHSTKRICTRAALTVAIAFFAFPLIEHVAMVALNAYDIYLSGDNFLPQNADEWKSVCLPVLEIVLKTALVYITSLALLYKKPKK